jgi:ElaB/YqjD/DUF883 family membrane-anchored ribosome-binding protein
MVPGEGGGVEHCAVEEEDWWTRMGIGIGIGICMGIIMSG